MERFKAAFQGKHNKLVDEIDVDHGLWTELRTRNVLTPQQLRDCQSYVCQYRYFAKNYYW